MVIQYAGTIGDVGRVVSRFTLGYGVWAAPHVSTVRLSVGPTATQWYIFTLIDMQMYRRVAPTMAEEYYTYARIAGERTMTIATNSAAVTTQVGRTWGGVIIVMYPATLEMVTGDGSSGGQVSYHGGVSGYIIT